MSDIKCPICQNNLHKINIVVSTCTNDKCKLWGSSIPNLVLEALVDTKKKLDICVKALNKIANTDIKVIEKEPLYYARAMFSVTNNALARIQDIEQTKGGDK